LGKWERSDDIQVRSSSKAIPQVKEKKNQALCIIRLMTTTGRLAIVASMSASAQSYIGLSAGLLPVILRFQASPLLLIIDRATLALPFCATTSNGVWFRESTLIRRSSTTSESPSLAGAWRGAWPILSIVLVQLQLPDSRAAQ
jgi:hypothetical protein